MDTKILPVVPQKAKPKTEQEKWKEEAVAVYRKARASRTYEDLMGIAKMMYRGKAIIKNPRDEPLLMEMAELLRTVARSMANGGFKVSQAFLLFYFIGDLLSDCGDYETAHYCFDRAIAINANDDDVYFSKAWAYGESGQPEKAIEYYEKTVDVNPAHHKAWAMLGAHYRIANKFGRAKKCYEYFLAISSDENENVKMYRETARKWLPCLNRKIELFGEELK
jgi:tetratricopeptide (TPR) repeat protein